MMYYSQNGVYPATSNYDSWRRVYSTGLVNNDTLLNTVWKFKSNPNLLTIGKEYSTNTEVYTDIRSNFNLIFSSNNI